MKYGFIGTGNMASALIKVLRDVVDGNEVYLSNRTILKADKLAKEYNCVLSNNLEIAEKCKYVILGVKPQMMETVISEIKNALSKRNDFILVSMAAGLCIEDYYSLLGFKCPLIRLMPNTPVSVRQGVIIYTSKNTNKEDVDVLVNDFKTSGRLVEIDEAHFDQAGTISGCGPAFMDIVVESLSDGGVYTGLTRKDSIELAAAMMMGSAKLILETGRNPIELKDEVTSPGGTTIEGVKVLEEKGVHNAFMEAVVKAYKKNELLRKK